MNEAHKIIAVYGNSGSFKTATSVNLAKSIARKEAGAKVAVVGLDHTKPLIPLLFPETKPDTSFGKLLACENLNHDMILSQMNTSGNIGFLGYNTGENCLSHARPTNERIDDFLMQMRHLINYTIIDCTHDVAYKLTAKSLINADNVLYLISCDVNGLVFHQSQEPILLGEQYGYGNYLRFLTISGRFSHDEETMQNAVGQIDDPRRAARIIPYSESLPELWNQGKALSPVTDVKYSGVLSRLTDFLTGGED